MRLRHRMCEVGNGCSTYLLDKRSSNRLIGLGLNRSTASSMTCCTVCKSLEFLTFATPLETNEIDFFFLNFFVLEFGLSDLREFRSNVREIQEIPIHCNRTGQSIDQKKKNKSRKEWTLIFFAEVRKWVGNLQTTSTQCQTVIDDVRFCDNKFFSFFFFSFCALWKLIYSLALA